jgi:sRNA-binding carbon storage regulator CsrA
MSCGQNSCIYILILCRKNSEMLMINRPVLIIIIGVHQKLY